MRDQSRLAGLWPEGSSGAWCPQALQGTRACSRGLCLEAGNSSSWIGLRVGVKAISPAAQKLQREYLASSWDGQVP